MNKFVSAMLLLVMLAALSAPAMGACIVDVATVRTETLTNGTLYADGEYDCAGSPLQGGKTDYTIEFAPIPDGATIKWARLYWHIWGSTGGCTMTNATFCNSTSCAPRRTIDLTPANCNQNESEGFYKGGLITYWVYLNVTNLVTVGANNVTINNMCDDGRSMQCYLVVAYEKTGYPTTKYWVNQGYKNLGTGSNHITTFAGSADTSTNGTLWQLGLAHDALVRIWFNNYITANTTGCGNYGCLEQYEIPASRINAAAGNTLKWDDISDPYYYPVLAMFMDEGPPGKNLVVDKIEPPEMMRSATTTVNITVKNIGSVTTGTTFNVNLKVDGGTNYSSTVTGVGPLGSGDSAIVSFTGVNLGEGCHEFNATADCDDDVDESMEGDNFMVTNHQVGYVIVVESNSDFERLNTTGDSPLPTGCFRNVGGTYYILNLTITNCAGDGITIENTNVPFVIDNCTIHDCTGGSSGVFMNNVTGGTVTNCMIHNNKDYGIELGLVSLDSKDPKFVNITCNTIYENGLSGIDLIGYNCTVKCNTIRDNDHYGIYVFGNDSKIYNNTIENNAKYGVKMYNSSGNYICRNDIIGNNGTGVQGYDEWLGQPGLALNHWNTTLVGNYCYKNVIRSNLIGNHWSDHKTPDVGDDGIVDTSYTIDGGAGVMDSVPQVVQWRLCGDVDRDGKVNIFDGKKVASGPGAYCACIWAADVNCDDLVNIFDGKDIAAGKTFCCICHPCVCGPCSCN